MPKRVDPNAIYTSDELHEILRGFVKIETLRRYGLMALPGAGYFGRNILDALDACCRGERVDRPVHERPSRRPAVRSTHQLDEANAGRAGSTRPSQKSETQTQKLMRLWREEQEAQKRR